jgi:hypothetical protein
MFLFSLLSKSCAPRRYQIKLIPIGSIQFGVIAGLDPAIHPLRKKALCEGTDPRVKPAGDGGGWCGDESSRSEFAPAEFTKIRTFEPPRKDVVLINRFTES